MNGSVGTLEATAQSPEARGGSPDKCRNILGVDVAVVDRCEAILQIDEALLQKQHRKYAFLNANGANIATKNACFRNSFAQFKVLADGIGVDIASRGLYGEPFPDNLNGTDFIPALLKTVRRPLRVGLIGAEPGVAVEAADKFAHRFPHHAFDVYAHGFFDEREEHKILSRLADDRPDILLVALGNPHQEIWIAEKCTDKHATIVFGVGALFDFVAGRVTRAPKWWIDLRIEWLYRLLLEPRRLWRRYVLGNPAFLLRVARQRLTGGPQAGR